MRDARRARYSAAPRCRARLRYRRRAARVVVGAAGIVGVANEVGDRRIAQHASAVGQRRADEAQHLSVGEIDVDRRGIAGPHHFGALGDEGAQFVLGQFPGAGVAAVIHQRDERRLAVGLLVGQRKIIAEGAVDEFGAGIGIEQHDADVDLVERGRQPRRRWHDASAPTRTRRPIFCRNRPVMSGGAAGGRRQQQHARQVRRVVTGHRAVVEEEQRRGRHRNDGADHAGGDAAEGGGKGDDADEQRRGIGDGNEMPVDQEGDQRRRCRESRTGNCAPVELHARSRCLPRIRAPSMPDRCDRARPFCRQS